MVALDGALIWGVFTRALGLVAFIHFASLGGQLLALVGSRGLEPASLLFRAVRRDLTPVLRVLRFPSLFLIKSSDGALRVVWALGALASVGIVVGAGSWTPWLFLLCWVSWLSIQTSNTTLFSFPWDLLLSECLFFGALLPPLGMLPDLRCASEATPAVAWCFNWILFRVMFGMGLTRFREQGETERDRTYIFHFLQWQPTPTPVAWWLRALPMAFHKAAFGFLFVAEVVAPFGMFGPPWMRIFALVCTGLLQLGIGCAGNYGVFNILTLVLCVPLTLPMPELLDIFVLTQPVPLLLAAHFALSFPSFLVANYWLTTLWLYRQNAFRGTVWAPLVSLLRFFAPFRIFNSYGVFRHQEVYVRDRLVVMLQGTADGELWREYPTRFLTGSPKGRPRFYAPHHPRLDQYLFYGLCEPPSIKMAMFMACNPYYLHPFCLTEKLIQKLLRNDPVALGFFAENPFPDAPPKAMRFALYRCAFTSAAERAATGAWWNAQLLGTSGAIERMDLPEDHGIHRVYQRFLSESLTFDPLQPRTFADPQTGETVHLQLHPVERPAARRTWGRWLKGRGGWAG